MTADTLMAFIAASVVLSFAPGPDNIFVLTQSALHGRRAGFFITLGLCTGLLVHTAAVAMGIAAIFLISVAAFTALKFIGACYLLFLAWQALKASSATIDNKPSPALSSVVLYRRGIVMNLTNPKIAIFFLAFLPQFAEPAAGSLSLQLLILGSIFIGVALVVFSFIAMMSGFIAHWLKTAPKAQRLMNRIAALVFFSLAVRLASTNR